MLAGGGLFVLAFLVAALERSQEHGEKHGFGANLLGAALITIFAGCINWYIQQEFSGFIVAALFFGVLSFIIVSLYQFVTTFKKTAAVIVLLLAAPVLFSWFPNLIATAFLAGGVIALFKLRQFLENYEAGKEQKRFQQRLIAMQQEAIQTYGNSQFQHIEKIYKKAVPLNKIEGVILGKVELPGKPARYVDFRDGDHLLTIAPTGAGKGTGSIIPALLTYPGAAFVIDPKGENAAVTARRRRELGQKVFLFDPFGLVTQDTAAWNPLDAVNKNNPNYADDAAAIADAIAVPPGGKADPHWYNAALELLTAIILYLGIIETDPKKKNLAQLRKILTSDIKTIRELFEQIHKTAQGPARDAAGTVITKAEKELSSVISSAQTYTRFLKSELIARTLSHSSFDPADLHSGKATAFVILPNRYLNAYSGWLRLMITHFLNGINAIGKKPEKQILFIVDEAAAVGNLKAITDGYAQMRSYGIQLWPFFQDRAQIKATYAEIGDTMITNAAVKQVFGINDHNTAKWISDELGKRGVVTEQHSYEPINPNSQPRNNIGFAIRERALMTPDELRASTSNILMFKEAEKMRLDKLRYHDDPDFEGLHDENPQITGKPGPGPLFFEPDLSQGNLPPPQDKKRISRMRMNRKILRTKNKRIPISKMGTPLARIYQRKVILSKI